MTSICVLIATNSKFKLLRETILSIKNQTRKLDQLVLVNDNGPYKKQELENLLKGTNIPYIIKKNNHTKGLTKSLIIGMNFCTQEYIARADSGDLWHPDKIMLQENFLEKNPEICCVGSQCSYFTESHHKCTSTSDFPNTPNEIKNALSLIGKSPASHSSILIKKEDLNYDILYKKSQDLDLYLRLISSGKKIANLNKVLSYVYCDQDGISINQKPSQLRYIYRAHHNYNCRLNKLNENRKAIPLKAKYDFLWFFAKPFYKKYVHLNKKNFILKLFNLIFCLIIYPPLIPFYIFRISLFNKIRLFIYACKNK